ncbi:MAG: four helix bundle protein [Gemmatimonadaceae bacterium]|nr:four helix bundle protein [Gemmatimonadaceae bacterium]
MTDRRGSGRIVRGMEPYERLIVWQKSHALATDIYRLTATAPRDPLCVQLRRAGASVPTNLVEGLGGGSRAMLGRFVGYACASAYEVEYLLRLAAETSLIPAATADRLRAQAVEVKRMLHSLKARTKERASQKARPS